MKEKLIKAWEHGTTESEVQVKIWKEKKNTFMTLYNGTTLVLGSWSSPIYLGVYTTYYSISIMDGEKETITKTEYKRLSEMAETRLL